MNYIILVGCDNPETLSVYSMITTKENVVFDNVDDAQDVVKKLNRIEGEGFSRAVAV